MGGAVDTSTWLFKGLRTIKVDLLDVEFDLGERNPRLYSQLPETWAVW
jgi:hypothetical protein